jgi:hypothetical protein
MDNVRSVCESESAVKYDSIINEIFQLDIMLILPGQELPMHFNVPYFWGADRERLPHWLLVLMKSSKLIRSFIYTTSARFFMVQHRFKI